MHTATVNTVLFAVIGVMSVTTAITITTTGSINCLFPVALCPFRQHLFYASL